MDGAGEGSADAPRIQYRPLVAVPELQQDWHDEQEERNVTWPELFFDLFFVAAISNLGHLFKGRPDAKNAGRIVLYHAIAFFLWADYATLRTRYRLQGLLFRSIGLTLQLGTLGFIIGVRNDQEWYHLLAGGYGIARAATSTVYAIIATTIPRARILSLVHLSVGCLLIAAAVCAAVFRETYATFHAIFVGVAILEAAIPLIPSLLFRQYDIPLHVEHMSERLGQLIMLHLGEAVIGFAGSPLENTVPQFVAVALAAVLVWCLHLCYYHIEPDQHDHAYRQSRVRGLLFFYCHWLLAVAFLLTGTGLRLMLDTYPGHEASSSSHNGSTELLNKRLTQPTAATALTRAVTWLPGWMGRSTKEQQTLEPEAPPDVALLLCVAYAASLHLLAVIRAAHYFSLDPQHRIVRHQERKGVKHWWNAWWGTLWLWPLPIYFIPMVIETTAGINSTLNSHLKSPAISGGLGANLGIYQANTLPRQTLRNLLSLSGMLSVGQPEAGNYTEHIREEPSGGLNVTALLAILAAHAVILTLAESLFAHKITKLPIATGLASAADSGPNGGAADAEAPAGHIASDA